MKSNFLQLCMFRLYIELKLIRVASNHPFWRTNSDEKMLSGHFNFFFSSAIWGFNFIDSQLHRFLRSWCYESKINQNISISKLLSYCMIKYRMKMSGKRVNRNVVHNFIYFLVDSLRIRQKILCPFLFLCVLRTTLMSYHLDIHGT